MRIAVPAAIDPQAFAGWDGAVPVVTLQGQTMGTTWRVLFAGRDADPARLDVAIRARLDGLVAQMSHWAPTSLLSRFNDAPAGSWVVLPDDFAAVMRIGLRVTAASDGAFDPAVGALVDLWGFGPPGAMPVPDAAVLADALGRSGVARLAWDDAAARLFQPGSVRLDLSGIAKGYAADALADLLAEYGVRHALVEVGGELVGRGVRPDGEPWWVDLEAPPGIPLAPLRVALHGLAVATSGVYVRGAHNLDPRTGMPAASDVLSASVVGTRAADVDAWATAMIVVGGEGAMKLADGAGLAVRLVTRSGERLSAAMRAMLE